MKFRRHPDRSSLRMNLTPLIDVVFLLLVFFMMTTTFNREAELSIDLPEARGAVSEKDIPPIRLIVTQRGDYAINTGQRRLANREVRTLRRALERELRKVDNKPALVISADAQAPHQAVMRAMEAARDVGFVNLNFEAQMPAEMEEE